MPTLNTRCVSLDVLGHDGLCSPIVCRLERTDPGQSLGAPDGELPDEFRHTVLMEGPSDAQDIGTLGERSAFPDKGPGC